jgi:hypothetical protein
MQFISLLNEEERFCWLQQDGATSHTANSISSHRNGPRNIGFLLFIWRGCLPEKSLLFWFCWQEVRHLLLPLLPLLPSNSQQALTVQ